MVPDSEVTKQPSRRRTEHDGRGAEDRTLRAVLRKAMIEQDADFFLKEGVRVLSQALMEMEVEEHVGARPHERSTERVGRRNGYRERSWDTGWGRWS